MRPLLFLLFLSMVACTGNLGEDSAADESYSTDQKRYGGLFKMNISEEVRSLFPLNLVDVSAFNLMNQVYEGLVRYDSRKDRVVPSLAESYTVSSDGLVYTFRIREEVYFHDDDVFENGEGREVKAKDVAYCFAALLTPSKYNQMSAFLIDLIRDGRVFYEEGGLNNRPNGLPAGIRVIDDFTIALELVSPTPNFPVILTHSCCWIYPKELTKYGNEMNNWCIGTGPFEARLIKMNEVAILERNNHYWRTDSMGQALPYLDAIRSNFIQSEAEQLRDFEAGYIDLLFSVPLDQLAALQELSGQNGDHEAYKIMTFPGLRVEYYGFQNRSELFSDERIRHAFNLAINREYLVDSMLYGFGKPAEFGFVPPAMPHYHSDSIRGYSFMPDSARALLAEAGYPNGAGFPILTLQVDDGSQTVIAVAGRIQRQLSKVLGITIELSVLPRDRHYEQVEEGNVDFWRDGWVADYPDPENFLKLFDGRLVPDDTARASYLNTARFNNPEFNIKFERSMHDTVVAERQELLETADQLVIDHAAVLPLYYPNWVWLVDNRVQNLRVNGMGHLDLTEVYLQSDPRAQGS